MSDILNRPEWILRDPQHRIAPTNRTFKLMQKYPTENYLLKFFAFDSGLGCFVSLYWNGIRNQNRKLF